MTSPSYIGMTNPLKDRLKAGQTVLGMNIRLARSGDIARIAKSTGHDFIFIDVQHSIFSIETIGHIAQTALGCGIAPLVRVRSCDDPDASLLLDSGVTGIVFPDVSTASDARRAVRMAKFAPIGNRSVAGGYAIFDYQPLPLAQAIPLLNELTLVVCMIETVEGLNNIEEICAVEGVDVIHIGSNDLLVAMGKPGAIGTPEHVAAVERIISVANAHGKFVGLGGVRDVDQQVEFIRKGARFVTMQTDIGLLMAEGSRRTKELREKLQSRKP